MKQKEFNRKLIDLFADKSSCREQHNGSPCNTCFHSMEADFNHITWMIVLYLRGDYQGEEIIDAIKEDLNK